MKIALPAFVDRRTDTSPDLAAAASLATGLAFDNFGAQHIKLRMTPSRAVFATDKIAKGGLNLVPHPSCRVRLCKVEDALSKNAMDVALRVHDHCPKGHVLCFASPSEGYDPLWFVQTTDDESSVNVKITTLSASVQAKGQSKGVKQAKAISTCIPVLTNTKALRRGDPLMLFCKKEKKRGSNAD